MQDYLYFQMFIILFVIALHGFGAAQGFIGYDCTQKFSNFSTFSLIDIGECDIPDPTVNSTQVEMTLLQMNDYAETNVKFCKIKIKRTILYCGYLSHMSMVRNSEVEYLKEISREECTKMHQFKSVMINENLIQNLVINETVTHPILIAGTLRADGSCAKSGHYADPYGEYFDVVVSGYVTIQLEERFSPVNLNSNVIKVAGGTTCPFSPGTCIDSLFGHAFWDIFPPQQCNEKYYSALYSGLSTKVMETGNQRRPLYVVETQDCTFAFKDMGKINICSFNVIRTEHPKLFILEKYEMGKFQAEDRVLVHNIDIFAYINSKFVYVERHIKNQLSALYQDVLMKQCALERKIIANALSIASIAPDVFAFHLMGKPGFMSLLAGEVVHILQCVKVEVRTRDTEDCYQELPVWFGNESLFLAPHTHVLKQYGTKTACDNVMSVMFKLGNTWLKLLPSVTTQGEPQIIKPNSQPTWEYNEALYLAKNGIYSYRDIERLKNYIMFPSERGAVLDQLAKGATGRGTYQNGVSVSKMLDEETLKKIAESAWDKIWQKFITFGSISAAFFSLLMIVRLIKFALDTIIHGYALHQIYGFSIHLLAACWNSLTNLLLHLGKVEDKKDKDQNKSEENHELQNIATAPIAATLEINSDNKELQQNLDENRESTKNQGIYPKLNRTDLQTLFIRPTE